MKISEQIIQLNNEVMVKLAPSEIHGVGVFAIRDIKKGERMYCNPSFVRKFYNIPFSKLNKLRPEIKSLIIERWPSLINFPYFQSPNDDAWPVLFMNHSDEQNYDYTTDCAIRDIKKGEEITENYKLMKNYEKVCLFLV